MTDKEKIRKKVEKLKFNLVYGACSSQVAMETRCKEEAYNEVLAILDTMKEESVSKYLEEAANNALNNVLNTHEIVNVRSCLEMFKLGAKWQEKQDQETIELAEDHAMLAGMEKMKEQMMKNAVGGYVIKDIEEGNGDFLLSADYLPVSMGLKDQQKVKVIILKDE